MIASAMCPVAAGSERPPENQSIDAERMASELREKFLERLCDEVVNRIAKRIRVRDGREITTGFNLDEWELEGDFDKEGKLIWRTGFVSGEFVATVPVAGIEQEFRHKVPRMLYAQFATNHEWRTRPIGDKLADAMNQAIGAKER
jgi:hypothetical protein